jgi:hypothetical protein
LTSSERIKGLIAMTSEIVWESVTKTGWIRYLNFRALPVVPKHKKYSNDRLNAAVAGLLVTEVCQVERQGENCAAQDKYTPALQSADRSNLGYPVTLFPAHPAAERQAIPNEQDSERQEDWRGRDKEHQTDFYYLHHAWLESLSHLAATFCPQG